MDHYIMPVHGEIGVDFTIQDTLLHLNNAKNYDSLMLDVNSPGGYTDEEKKITFAIIESGKIIYSRNSGDVASAASKIFTIPPLENRTFDPSKGVFLIHNPWVEVSGDSEFLKQASDEIKKYETDYVKWYCEKTGTEANIIKGFMKENIPLTEDQVEQLNFAKIIKPVINPVARIKLNINTNPMNEEKLNSIEKAVKALTDAFKKLIPKAIMIVDASGNELEFPDVTSEDEITTGVKANVAGSPANGEYVMQDGRTIVCVDGVVSEIIEPTSEVEALKAENETLQAKIAELTTEKDTVLAEAKALKTNIESVNKEMVKLKNIFSKDNNHQRQDPPSSPQGGSSKFTYKKRK